MKGNVKKIAPDFMDQDGHLNDSGISLVVEARLLNKMHKLPKEVKNHLEECASCQMRVVDFHQFMKNEAIEVASPHPFLDAPSPQNTLQGIISSKYFIGRVAAIILLLIAGYWMLFEQAQTTSQTNPEASQVASYASPFDKNSLDVPFNTWEMNADQAKVFKLKNGSNIHVPAQAFVDQQGRAVKGKVKIKYREFHNAADIIASGIPMHYDSAGTRYHFESGGMFEIRGNQNGAPVYLANDKSIDVNMVSYHQDKNFNHYYLDEGTPRPQAQPVQAQMMPDLSFRKAPKAKGPQWKLISKAVAQPIAQNTEKSKVGEQMAEVKPKILKDTVIVVTKQDTSRLQDLPMRTAETLMRREKTPELKKPVWSEFTEQKRTFEIPRDSVVQRTNKYFKLKFALDYEPELKRFQNVKWDFVESSPLHDPQTSNNAWVLKEAWHKIKLTKLPFGFKTLKAHQQGVVAANYSLNGKYILTQGVDRSAKLFDRKGNLLKSFPGVKYAQLSKTGRYLLLTKDTQLEIWTLDGLTKKVFPQKHPVKMAILADDEKHIITTTRQEVSKIIDLEGKVIKTFKESFKYASFSPNGKYVATISDRDFSLKIWTSRGKYLHQLKGEYNTVSFSADSRHMLTSSDHNAAQLWFLETSYFNTMLITSFKHHARVNKARFSKDGKSVLTASNDGTAKLWNISGKRLRTFKIEKYKWVNDAVFSPDNKRILTANSNGNAQIWDAQTGKLIHTLRGHGKALRGASFSPDQQGVLTYSDDHTIIIWDSSLNNEGIYAMDLSNIGPRYNQLFEQKMQKFYRREIRMQPSKKTLKKFFTIVKLYEDPSPSANGGDSTRAPSTQLADLKKQYAQDVIKTKEQLKKIDTQNQNLRMKEAQWMHSFRVTRMGVCNIDRIKRLFQENDPVIFAANIKLGNDHDDRYRVRFYQVTGAQSTAIIQYNPQDLRRFAFSPQEDNQLVVILPKNKVAVFTPAQFKQIDIKKLREDREYLFDLTKTRTIRTKREFDQLLGVTSFNNTLRN